MQGMLEVGMLEAGMLGGNARAGNAGGANARAGNARVGNARNVYMLGNMLALNAIFVLVKIPRYVIPHNHLHNDVHSYICVLIAMFDC